MTTDPVARAAERYDRFARFEAPGRSVLYADWARGVVRSPAVLAVLARIPEAHRQPPLVFAVTRLLGAPERPFDEWAAWVLAHSDALVAECGVRSVQTNEPLRCAALLPALSLIDGPIALLELGASAGLCLFPDRYSYRYRTDDGADTVLHPAGVESAVVLEARLTGAPVLRLPDVVWRAGIDLHPLDARARGDRRWLSGLVWPGERGRRARIEAALDIAAADPPRLFEGDAEMMLPVVAGEAPEDATLVITTPGVLPYIGRGRRRGIIELAQRLARWITIDAPATHDAWTTRIPSDWPEGRFALALDGEVLAAVDPLGASVEWRGGAAAHGG